MSEGSPVPRLAFREHFSSVCAVLRSMCGRDSVFPQATLRFSPDFDGEAFSPRPHPSDSAARRCHTAAPAITSRRLQQRQEGRAVQYQGLRDAVRTTWTREGMRGFYRGMVPHLAKTAPNSAITFMVYEGMLRLLSGL